MSDDPSELDWFYRCEEAVEEVWKRGVDERRRLVRGRVLVELRCKRKGHLIARVYPSSFGPLFVPLEDNDFEDSSNSWLMVHKSHQGACYCRMCNGRRSRKNPHWFMASHWYEAGQVDVPGGSQSILLLTEDAPVGDEAVVLCRCGRLPLPPLRDLIAACREAEKSGRVRRVAAG